MEAVQQKLQTVLTGLLENINLVAFQVGTFTTGFLRYVEAVLLKFDSFFFFFKGKGELTSDANKKGATSYKWVKVISVSGSGTTEDTTTGDGPIRT